MFQLETATKAKLVDVIVLSSKNRQPDENPGAKLSFEMSLGNDSLAYFDGGLKSALFTKNGKPSGQGTLDGVAPVSDTPNLTGIGLHVPVLHWELELTGYALTIDHGMGGKSNIEIADCTLSNFRIAPKEGGTVQVKFDAESNDVTEKAFGKLATLKTREIAILLAPPEVDGQAQIDDTPPQAGKSATGLFVAGEPAWPFPKNGSLDGGQRTAPPQSVTVEQSQPGTRTARGREKTAKALAAGAQG